MFTRWGYDEFAHNVRDRVEMIVSAVTTEVCVLPESSRNGMKESDWAYYVERAIRQEFPDMSVFALNARYVAILVERSKKSVSLAFEWFGAGWPHMSYTDRLVELHHRSERVQKSESREYNVFLRKVWRWAIRRSGWDYARSARFADLAHDRIISYQVRHLDG